MTACQSPVAPPAGSVDADAAAKTTALIGAVLESRATGDFGSIEAILQEGDPQGELRRVLQEGGVFTRAVAKSGEEPVQLPALAPGVYQTGDVLVCRGSGTLTSNLMDLVLVNGYGHAGILNKDLGETGAECILSADLDYLTEGQGEALNYESYLDWMAKNDLITVLRPNFIVEDIGQSIAAVAGLADGGTIYAFLGYPGAVVGAFQPIPRTNDDYWYCSKVPWRVYENIEDVNFYYDGYGLGQRWMVVRQSLLYKVYLCYLKLLYPWRGSAWRVSKADRDLRAVLGELITPDELRASDKLQWIASMTPAGPVANGLQEAALVGWAITY